MCHVFVESFNQKIPPLLCNMSHRNRSSNTGIDSDDLPESPPTSRHLQRRTTTPGTTSVVPRGQDRPRISVERSRSENRIRRDLQLGSTSDPEETSPIYPPVASTRLPTRLPVLSSIVPCRTPSSLSSSRSTPATTPLSHVNAACRASCCDHERQFDALQRKLAVLTEKIDNLQGQRSAPAEKRKSENLPRDMVACVHKVVGKLKEKDPPTQWRFEPDHSFNDDTNLEVTQAIERGVRATSAFKEAVPVLLERAIKTYFKTLKAKSQRLLTRVRNERLPQVANKQDESVINSRRNQRGHNKLKSRRVTLRQSSYTEAKKGRLEEVISIEYMSPEESEYESNEEGGERTMNKLVIRRFEWRSEELTREFQSLDRKANRARSERGRRMMVKREEGGFLPNTLHCYPKSAPAWALCVQLQAEPNIRPS